MSYPIPACYESRSRDFSKMTFNKHTLHRGPLHFSLVDPKTYGQAAKTRESYVDIPRSLSEKVLGNTPLYLDKNLVPSKNFRFGDFKCPYEGPPTYYNIKIHEHSRTSQFCRFSTSSALKIRTHLPVA
ncbi:hypothetical protein TNIN_216311 [Trichonephila inaurata madagascariensis]|uniref:Uncharacterized protein n=1 Tax=Trichonephila inaurata madagascariensis TaxID=2747483 RepID=A0A8X6YXE2_9ARAC|nr:hypothetical protein TNIN_216311 [Trichonephila inaurata madagascariensis]